MQALVNIAWSFATLLGVACCQQPAIHQLFLLIHSESLTRLRCTALALSSGQNLPYVGGGGFNEQALSNAVYAFDKVGLLSSELLSAVFEVSALRLQRGSASHHPDLASFKPQELCTLLKACHANIAPPWTFLGSLLQLLSTHPSMADSWTAQERLELHRACQLYLVHQTENNEAGSGLGGIGLAAAAALANSLANSVGVSMSSGPPSTGRMSNTGSSLTPTALGSSIFSSQAGRISGTGGSGPPSGQYGSLLPSLAAAGGPSPRTSFTSGTGFIGSGPASGDPLISTFGQLPATQSRQPAAGLPGTAPGAALQLQQQQNRMPSSTNGANNTALMQLLLQQQQQQQVLNCPICGVLLRPQDALAHTEACIAANRTAAGLEALLRQQQQQQQQQAVARWAAQQQAAQSQQLQLLASQLQHQQQQNLLAAAQQVAAQQQQAAAAAAAGVLGLDDLCRPAGAVDATALTPWMTEAAAAARPPLRPSVRRF